MAEKKDLFSEVDLAEAYSLAITLEEDGYQFYDKASEHMENTQAKNELAYLRDEEKKHKAVFEKLLEISGSEYKEDNSSELHKWVEAELIMPMKQALEEKLPSSASEALRVGVVLEEKSIIMYERMKKAAQDKESIKAIKNIIKEEKKHKKKLNIILAY